MIFICGKAFFLFWETLEQARYRFLILEMVLTTLMKLSKCKYFRGQCLYIPFNNVNSCSVRDRLEIFTKFLVFEINIRGCWCSLCIEKEVFGIP